MDKIIVTGTGCLTAEQARNLSKLHGVSRAEPARHLLDFVALQKGTALVCETLPAIYDRDATIVPASSL